jgi:hypothetical protein
MLSHYFLPICGGKVDTQIKYFSPQIGNPQNIGLITLSQTRKFLLYVNLKITKPQISFSPENGEVETHLLTSLTPFRPYLQ